MTTPEGLAVAPTAPTTPAAQALLLAEYLRRLRLPVVRADYPKVAQEAAQRGLPYEQFLLLLLEHEVIQRDENMQRRRIGQAKFPVVKTLDQFDFSLAPRLNRPLVLELAQGHYLEQKENVLLVGEVGTGKTHIATALAVAACRQGYRVRFFTAAGLTNELLEAQGAHRLGRFESQLLRHHLLVLDEVGFVPFSKTGADLLFSFLSAVHEQASLLVTTNLEFADWTQVFGDQRLTVALLDRLTFHAHILPFHGESYRLRQSVKRQEREGRPRSA